MPRLGSTALETVDLNADAIYFCGTTLSRLQVARVSRVAPIPSGSFSGDPEICRLPTGQGLRPQPAARDEHFHEKYRQRADHAEKSCREKRIEERGKGRSPARTFDKEPNE
jgi:hypothetical protein